MKGYMNVCVLLMTLLFQATNIDCDNEFKGY